MSRLLSLTLFAFFAAVAVPSSAVTAQDADSLREFLNNRAAVQDHRAVEFERVGVDFTFADESNVRCCQEPISGKNEISIELKCDCDIPFLSNLPLINHLFGNASNQDCEIVVVDATCDACCGSCKDCATCKKGGTDDKDGATCCEKCKVGCGDQQSEFRIVSDLTDVPFFSNIPYANRLFKNVGLTSPHVAHCQDSDCPSASARTACPAARCGNINCETDGCHADAQLQLASHFETSNEETDFSREEMMHDMMEMAVENARLETAVEAMENQMELMEEMFEVRVENAALKAQLKYMEKDRAQKTAFQPIHPSAGNILGPHVVIGMPHPIPATFSPHGPHFNSAPLLYPPATPASYPIVLPSAAINPPITASEVSTPAAKCQKWTLQLNGLQKESTQRASECSNGECSKGECKNSECTKSECQNAEGTKR